MAANLQDLVQRLESVVNHFEGLVFTSPPSSKPSASPAPGPASQASPSSSAPAPALASPAVQAYDSQILSKFPALNELAAKIDPQIASLVTFIQTLSINEAYSFNRSVVDWTQSFQKPTEDETRSLQSKLSTFIKKVADLKDSRNPLNNFFLFSIEVVQATLWVISPMPAPTAESFIETSAFYGNKILMQKQGLQVAWVKGFNEVVRANVSFVKEFFATGLTWNPSGRAFSLALSSSSSNSSSSSAGKAEEAKAPVKKAEEVKANVVKKKEPKKFERGISWIFEHFENDKTMELSAEDAGMKKAVMIDNCLNCVIQIKGKVKNVVVSGCKGTSIVCQDVVSGIEFINCAKMQVQSTGLVPSVSIDKTDGIQIYITREALKDIMFSTSKSADMNIVAPGANPGDDYIEMPIPHQYVHRIVNGKITCAPSDLYSH